MQRAYCDAKWMPTWTARRLSWDKKGKRGTKYLQIASYEHETGTDLG
jgi:hypothetical protein